MNRELVGWVEHRSRSVSHRRKPNALEILVECVGFHSSTQPTDLSCISHPSGNSIDGEQCAIKEFFLAVARIDHPGTAMLTEAFEEGDLEKSQGYDATIAELNRALKFGIVIEEFFMPRDSQYHISDEIVLLGDPIE